MNAPSRRLAQKPKKKLPYLTDEELNAKVATVKIQVSGEYFKRGEHRQDVYEEQYTADIVVPKLFNMGHVKLQTNRYVKDPKNKLNGVRVRTFNVDADFAPEPYTEKEYRAKDFISDMGLADNERSKQSHLDRLERKRIQREMEEDPDYAPPIGSIQVQSRVTEDHDFGIREE